MVIYDPEAAKAEVLSVYEKLKSLNSDISSAMEANSVTDDLFATLFNRYEEIPSFDIDWKVAGLDPEEGKKLAAQVREQLQQITGMIGVNKHIPERFVGSQ